MASIQPRTSRGKKYWSIVESRRIRGKPRTVILEYLGTADTLLGRLQDKMSHSIKSYSHGDTSALINAASELGIVDIINKHIPHNKNGIKQTRDGLTVGASFLLAAIGRACHPTSKLGWYDWCRETSLEYCLRSSFKGIDSQHFWDQMDVLPVESIPLIEEEIVSRLVDLYEVDLDCLFYDTTNYFTFIDSTNNRCDIARRGRNKQRRCDLRQVGMALLVTRKDQFPLFHSTYRGNKDDTAVFKEIFRDLIDRMKRVSRELAEITIVFDKGNNSKINFEMIDGEEGLHYVGSLVPSQFKSIIREANRCFSWVQINGEDVPAYQTKKIIWGKERTCVVTVSEQLRDGQLRGIHQILEKKYNELESWKRQLENPKRRKRFARETIERRLKSIIKGQFIEEILKYELVRAEDGTESFTYGIDALIFEKIKKDVLGRQIIITNRHTWTSEEIILAYHGQSKVEYAFRTLKNPYHLAVRPQYHWTDQKIEAHFLICVLGYLLAVAVYSKAKKWAGYQGNIGKFMDELRGVRLACIVKKKGKNVVFQLETFPTHLRKTLHSLNISNSSLRSRINISDYT